MSHIGISLSANTASYVKRIKDARTETDRNIIKMEQRIDQFAQDVNKNFTSVSGSIDTMIGGLRNIKGGGYVAAIAGIGVASVAVTSQLKQLATQTVETQKEIRIAAERAKVSADEIQRMGAVAATVGLSLEKFGDINKDVFDKMGDYATTGGGAFVDFFDVVKDKSDITISELQKLSGPDVLMKVVSEMEKVGASGSQMTWVLESLGNDASNLLPLLRDNAAGFKELKARLDEMDTVPEVLASATKEVQIMDSAFNTMWNNFGVLMTNQFEGLFKYLSDGAIWINNFFAGINKNSQIEYQMEMIKNGSMSITGNDSAESLQHKQDAIMRIAKESIDLNSISTPYLKEISKLESRLHTWQQTGKKSAEEMEALQNDIIAKRIEAEDAKHEAIQKAAEETYGKELKAIKDLQAARGYKADDVGIGGEFSEKTFKVEKADSESKYTEEKDKLNVKLKAAIKEKELAEKTLADLIKARDSATTKEGKDTIEAEIKKQKKVVETHIKHVEQGNESLAELDKNEADRKQKVSDEAVKLSKEEARQKKEIADRHAASQMEAAQREVNAAKTTAEKLQAIEKMKLLSLSQMQARYYDNLNKRVKDGSISEVEAKREELEAEMQFQAARTNILKESANQIAQANEAEFTKELDRKAARAEAGNVLDLQLAEEKLAWYAENKELFFGMEKEYEDRVHALKMEKAEAEKAIEAEKFNIVRGSLDEIAGAFDEHTGAARAAFALSKGISIAEATINMEANALKAKRAAMGMGTSPADVAAGETAAMVSRIKDGVSIATMTAQAIGQFHSGTDEVDQTGSYILQSGERVVQRAANKDLTNFLESNQSGSGAVTIDAPLVIEGDVNVDENRLNAWAVSHREHLAKVFKLAQRENPSLR